MSDKGFVSQQASRDGRASEPSLVELAMAVRRHWRSALVVGALAGVGVLLLFRPQPAMEVLTASVEIGRRIVGDQPVIIEPPNVLLARVNDVIIPRLLAERRAEGRFAVRPSARMPDGGSVLTVEVVAASADTSEAAQLLDQVRARVRESLGTVVDRERANFNGAMTFVEEENKGRKADLAELERRLGELRAVSARDAAGSLQGLVIAELRRDSLYREFLTLGREYQAGLRELRQLVAQRDALRDTTDLGPPVREVRGGGRGLGQTVGLALVAAAVAGMLGALMAEYLMRVRTTLRQTGG